MANLYQYIDSTGLIVPDTATILAGVYAEYQAAFGSDIVLTPDTPQGVLATAEALARTQVVQNNAAITNMINPDVAAGVFLDALLALTGMQRTPATQTLVTGVTLSGVAGTVIPAGTLAATAAGDQFASLSTVTIGGGGTITVNFASVAYGPIPCDINALNVVVTNVLGWETVNNTVAGIVGASTQSDIGARSLRNNTLAFNGVSLAESITSALYNVPGVTSLFFQENVAATTQTINGISMVAHSVYACVNGGSDLNVAAALLENKSSGAGWNGGTSVSVIEPASGQTYTVKFDRPTPVEITVQITSPNAALADLQTAVLSYAAGQVAGYVGWTVGAPVNPFEIAGAILLQFPYMTINSVFVALAPTVPTSSAIIAMNVNQIAFSVASDITLVT